MKDKELWRNVICDFFEPVEGVDFCGKSLPGCRPPGSECLAIRIRTRTEGMFVGDLIGLDDRVLVLYDKGRLRALIDWEEVTAVECPSSLPNTIAGAMSALAMVFHQLEETGQSVDGLTDILSLLPQHVHQDQHQEAILALGDVCRALLSYELPDSTWSDVLDRVNGIVAQFEKEELICAFRELAGSLR